VRPESSALDTLDRFTGAWLRSTVAEAFISILPYPRVMLFRPSGGSSPLRLESPHPYVGIRTWFLDPEQTERSTLPADQPAWFNRLEPLIACVEAEVDPVTGLQNLLEVTLDPAQALMTVRHGLRNAGITAQTISVWAIAAFTRQGRILAPWGPDRMPLRRLTWYPFDNPLEPGLLYGKRALGIELEPPVTTHFLKVGVLTESGWGAHLHNEQALVITSPYVSGGRYPEGGSNLTFYNNSHPVDGFSEIEHVAPQHTLAPGETGWLDVTYRFMSFAQEQEAGEFPDDYHIAIEQQLI